MELLVQEKKCPHQRAQLCQEGHQCHCRMTIIDETLRSIAGSVLEINPERIVPETRFRNDLGADSLDLVEMIVALGQRFEADIRDEDIQSLYSFDQLVAYLEQRVTAIHPGERQKT